jgi:membrane-associated PAP2 superfamily phosphatase
LLGLWLMAWRPMGVFQRLDRPARLQLAGGTMAAVLLVSVLKGLNPAPCPWDLSAFGGTAQPLSHWQWWARHAVGGHCFPAGHASSAFAFISGWYVLRPVAPGLARAWLLGVLVAGVVLGLGQQWRGAHFTSHTLWTAWLCLAVAALSDRMRHRLAPVAATAVAAPESAGRADAGLAAAS